jgi:hypothetical protein
MEEIEMKVGMVEGREARQEELELKMAAVGKVLENPVDELVE